MLAVNALETNPDLTDEDILDLLSSNLCRCTGYQNIVKAVRSTAAEMRRYASALNTTRSSLRQSGVRST